MAKRQIWIILMLALLVVAVWFVFFAGLSLKPFDTQTDLRGATFRSQGTSYARSGYTNPGAIKWAYDQVAGDGYKFYEYKSPGAGLGDYSNIPFFWYADGTPVAMWWGIVSYDYPPGFDHSGDFFGIGSLTTVDLVALVPRNPGPIEVAIVHTPVAAADRARAETILETVVSRPMSVYHAEQFLLLLQQMGHTDNSVILEHLANLADGSEPLLGLEADQGAVSDSSMQFGEHPVYTYLPATLGKKSRDVLAIQNAAVVVLRIVTAPPPVPAAAAAPPAPEAPLVVIQALWKCPGYGDVDITRQLTNRVQGRILRTRVDPKTLDILGASLKPGYLLVTYHINGQLRTQSINAGEELLIEAPENASQPATQDGNSARRIP